MAVLIYQRHQDLLNCKLQDLTYHQKLVLLVQLLHHTLVGAVMPEATGQIQTGSVAGSLIYQAQRLLCQKMPLETAKMA